MIIQEKVKNFWSANINFQAVTFNFDVMKNQKQTKLYRDLREHLLYSEITDVVEIMTDIHNKEARGETLSEKEYFSAEIIDRIMSNFHWEMGKMDDMPLKEFKFFGEK